MVIDFHSHILPRIDDGSKDLDTSLEMLSRCRENGVDIMIATPHFYADEHRIEQFLERRQNAYEDVMKAFNGDAPRILLGGEVAYFSGMSKSERISDLTIQGTDILLVEMPFDTWNASVIKDIKELIYKDKLKVMIAHIERFTRIKGNKPYIKELLELPVIIQVNAEAITEGKQKSEMLKLFKRGQAQVLGSDCHGIHHRVPNLWEARDVIAGKLGSEMLSQIDEFGSLLLNDII